MALGFRVQGGSVSVYEEFVILGSGRLYTSRV